MVGLVESRDALQPDSSSDKVLSEKELVMMVVERERED